MLTPDLRSRFQNGFKASTKRIGGRRPLALEVLEDRLAPATLLQSFYPPNAVASQTGGLFGQATATDSNLVAVGMQHANFGGVQDCGAAFVYSAKTGILIATLANPSAASTDQFGISVSVSGNIVVVGAQGDDTRATNSGQAYVFNATTGALIATLANPSPADGDFFGGSVSVSGNTVVVGAINDDTGASGSGQAYVFNATTGALIATLNNPTPAALDLFGLSVSVSGNTVVVGAPFDDTGATDSGQAYVFDATTGALITNLSNPSPTGGNSFAESVSVSGNTVVVGATLDDSGTNNSGRAYVFNATSGALIATLNNPTPADSEEFGQKVSVSGNTVVVGARLDDTGATNSGQAYVFNATTGALIATLDNPTPASEDRFGVSVSVSGNIVVAGAFRDDTQGLDQGAAYVYSLDSGTDKPGWSAAASMSTARNNHTATLLRSGKVLVAGGYSRYSGGPLSSAEIYDPVSNTWSSAVPMSRARSAAAATLLSNGKLLVTGGYIDSGNAFIGQIGLADTELYDPTSNIWTSAASMAAPRSKHSAILLANGKVLVVGGYNAGSPLNSAELYDPASNTWSSAGQTAEARYLATATLLTNGKVLVAGGGGLSSAELYDPVSNAWSVAASMSSARSGPTATLLSNGMVLVTGGIDLTVPAATLPSSELYDPISNHWFAAASMATARTSHSATLLKNGKVLVTGGLRNDVFLSRAELYDPVSDTWSDAEVMSTPRIIHTATLLNSGKVLAAGGLSGRDSAGLIYESSAELYAPDLPVANATTTALTATPNAATGGQLVTFTATVGPSPGDFGTVTFKDNGTVLTANVAVMGGVALLQISSLAAGTHPIVAYYNGVTSFAASSSNTLNFVVSASAPQVLSVTPNGNIASLAGDQRSRVVSLVVAFNQPVQLDPSALTLTLNTNNVSVGGVLQPAGFGSLPTSLSLASSDKITWTITFVGNTDAASDGLGSLKDGVYDLNIDAAKVHPFGVPGITMAANRTTTFHRLFGDNNAPSTPTGGTPGTDFEAIVNTGDNLTFRAAFNRPAGGGYQPFLDCNGDGIINTADNLQFRSRFNKPLTWRV